mmetsp:Transcript_83861/g.227341  ORF Transcript_83861/g.227341 Transcript_83861/m.227341 type:complete len:98 (-) Transcript_83861:1526-1819(-)
MQTLVAGRGLDGRACGTHAKKHRRVQDGRAEAAEMEICCPGAAHAKRGLPRGHAVDSYCGGRARPSGWPSGCHGAAGWGAAWQASCDWPARAASEPS